MTPRDPRGTRDRLGERSRRPVACLCAPRLVRALLGALRPVRRELESFPCEFGDRSTSPTVPHTRRIDSAKKTDIQNFHPGRDPGRHQLFVRLWGPSRERRAHAPRPRRCLPPAGHTHGPSGHPWGDVQPWHRPRWRRPSGAPSGAKSREEHSVMMVKPYEKILKS